MSKFRFNSFRPLVYVQGLGFVGAAMALAIANARDKEGNLYFNVAGIDLENESGKKRIDALNSGFFPFETGDVKLKKAAEAAVFNDNFIASSSSIYFKEAGIILVDINLDISYHDDDFNNPYIDLTSFKTALKTIGENIRADALVIVETTVPPGTCEKVVKPLLEEELLKRNLPVDMLKIAHSYERVMPGINYYDSIVNFWRVFSGIGEDAQKACGDFLSKIINTKEYPLTMLKSTIASETAKVMENSYRAANIAFVEEWGRFAEEAGIDLFEVIDAIKIRPTHSNILRPGFGVGGYCLTKDPLFAKIAACDILGLAGHRFPFCTNAVKINRDMPLVSLNKIESYCGSLENKKVLLLGISYRENIGDTRYSPAETFVKAAVERGAIVDCRDPMVEYWPELDMTLPKQSPQVEDYDVIVLTVKHNQYLTLEFARNLSASKALVFDANNVLTKDQIDILRQADCKIAFIGRAG
jgi:nucleotide sugar dehydrogenase